MNSNKLAKIIVAIIFILTILGTSIYAISSLTKPDIDIPATEATVPEIPEGEPIITEDPTEPPTEPPVVMGTAIIDRLNVRNEPDINHYVSRQMPVGTRVEILDEKTIDGIRWGRIEDGWINLRYVDIDGEPNPGLDFTVDLGELRSLALVNYMEAGEDNCCDLCRRRICDVVLNRVADERWEDSIDEVLMEYCQFSYLWTGLYWPERASSIWEQHAIERAFRAAEEVLMGNHTDVYQQGYVYYQGINRTPDYIVCHDCGIWFSR